jgi:hypothetical protein
MLYRETVAQAQLLAYADAFWMLALLFAAAPLLLPFMRRVRLSTPPAAAKREGGAGPAAGGAVRDAPEHLARLTESTGGQLLYHFRRPWSDGSTALLLEPVELLERLAALVPPPRRPLLAYHGVLAPRAEWRSAIIPKPAPDGASADAGARSPGRWTWARLLRRVFAIRVLVCERGGGARRILGAVTAPHAVRQVLTALGLAAEPPPGRPVPTA